MFLLENCVYDEGEWGACNPRGMASRDDTLVSGGSKCFVTRISNKDCNSNKGNEY